jgi:hypothetical protein
MIVLEKLKEKVEGLKSKDQIEEFAKIVIANPSMNEPLIELLFEKETRGKVAWIISKACEQKSDFHTATQLSTLIEALTNQEDHSVKRNLWRSLNLVPIPSSHHETVINSAFSVLESNQEDIAVKVHAMKVLFSLIKEDADLCKALLDILQWNLENQSKGFQSRAKKIIHQIQTKW